MAVARLPEGKDPGELAQRDPDALAAAVDDADAVPRVPAAAGDRRPAGAHARGAGPAGRAGDGGRQRAPRRRTCASCTPARWPPRSACRSPTSSRSPSGAARSRRCTSRAGARRRAGERRVRRHRAAGAGLELDRRWLVEELFDDDANRMAFLALAEAGGDLDAALEAADPDAREVLERAAVADLDVDPEVEARNLIAAAVRRELAPARRRRRPRRDPRRPPRPACRSRTGHDRTRGQPRRSRC